MPLCFPTKEAVIAEIRRWVADVAASQGDSEGLKMPLADRYRQCLDELGVPRDGSLAQLVPISRLVADLIPERNQILELKSFLSTANKRRVAAEQSLDELRDGVERIICDCDYHPGKGWMIDRLEQLLRTTSPDHGES